jgi:hypothetical protein
MSNQIETQLSAFDAGFEKGSIAAANVIIAFLRAAGLSGVAEEVRAAWEAGTIANAAPSKADTEIQAAPVTKESARLSGYTGDACANCQSMQVRRNGSCLLCEACGQTTGCS